jgi:hypothetical protein
MVETYLICNITVHVVSILGDLVEMQRISRPFPGHCLDKGSVFQKWADARSPKSRVKYSKMMIETAENQLEKILREE